MLTVQARIKKIMQKDDEVGKVAQASPFLICTVLIFACCLFCFGGGERWVACLQGRLSFCFFYCSQSTRDVYANTR